MEVIFKFCLSGVLDKGASSFLGFLLFTLKMEITTI